jgi:hypothetical protein
MVESVQKPDPTVLTTENLRREIGNLKDLIESRLAANDTAIALVRESANKFREDHVKLIWEANGQLHALVSAELDKLASVTTERFTGVAAQFSERDTRTDQRAGDTKLAVDAAFAAAKEATAKIEAGFTKQIDAMSSLIDTKTGNLASSLGDLKERIVTIDARTQGMSAAKQESRNEVADSRGFIFGIVGTVISVGTLIAIVISHGH